MEILTSHGQDAIREALGIREIASSSTTDEIRHTMRQDAQRSLYYFATAILGYRKVEQNPHLELCSFIQTVPPRRKCVLIPRDCFKSTIGSKSLPLWILVQDEFCGLPGPEHRILLTSFSSENAKKQIKAIRQSIERNDILRWVFPELVPDFSRTTWTDSNLLFPREGVYGEDTIEAAGVDTHLVSRHYTVQIADDLEDLESYQSPTVRKKVAEFYKSSEALFVSEREAYHLLIGTRWGVDDIYSVIQANESETYAFLVRPLEWTREELQEDVRDAKEHNRPAIWNMNPDLFAPDPDQKYYFFPALFPEESCRRVRAKQGTFMYSMLYKNNPRDPSMAEFKSQDIQYFEINADGEVVINHGSGTIEIIPFELLRRVMFWDPALSRADKIHNARNAMVCMAKDAKGRFFLLEAFARRDDPTLLFAKFISLHRRWSIERAAIEDVAFQRVLKFPLYAAMRESNYRFPVREERPIGDKHSRIRALIPFHESHLLFVKRGLKDFVEELNGFPMFPTVDLLDAGAAAANMLEKLPAMTAREHEQEELAEQESETGRSTLTGY